MKRYSNLAEKRISPRKSLQTRVIFEDEMSEGFLYFFSTDISASGIFIESNIQFQIGTKLLLKFSLTKTDTPICVTGQVTRLMTPKRGPGRKKKVQKIGIGIRFLGLSSEDLKKIEEFIRS